MNALSNCALQTNPAQNFAFYKKKIKLRINNRLADSDPGY